MALVSAGALMTFQAFAVVGALPAGAAESCTFSGGALTVTLTADTDDVSFGVDDATDRIFVDFTPATVHAATDFTIAACSATADATLANTNTITVAGGAGNQAVTIELFDVVLPAGTADSTIDWGDINWSIDLGAEGAAPGDAVTITNADGDDAVSVTAGATGVDLNTDGDLDISPFNEIETFSIFGGLDDDTLSASGDTVTGALFPTAVTIEGGDGDDTVSGGAGGDTLSGDGVAGADEAGSLDVVSYAAATGGVIVDLDTSGPGQGTASGGGMGVDTLVDGGADNTFERIVGSGFNDSLTGDDADNRITPGAGDDTVDGDDDTEGTCDPAAGTTACGGDEVSYSDATAAVTIDLDAETVTGGSGNDTLDNIENAIGSDFDDMFVDGFDANNRMRGGAGNDTFDMGPDVDDGDFDRVEGESGVDWIDYSQRTEGLTVSLDSVLATTGATACDPGAGPTVDTDCGYDGDTGDEWDDVKTVENASLGTGDDSFTGNAFNNTVKPGGGQNVLDGLAGSDTLDYKDYEAGVEVNMAGGSTAGDSAVNFENARGSAFRDIITGNELSNRVAGRGGNDNIRLGSGDDTGRGGRGNDNIRGGSGDDDLLGARGNDLLFGGGGDDFGNGGPGKDVCRGVEVKRSCGTAKNPKAPQARVARLV